MIKVLQKVDNILGALQSDRGAAGFSDIQKVTGINKSTLSQILKSMNTLDWVKRDRGGEFSIGPRLMDYVMPQIAAESLRHAVKEATLWLAQETNHMASASTLIGNCRVRLTKVYGDSEIRVDDESFDEKSGGILSTATGKMLLAFQHPERRAELLEYEGALNVPEIESELKTIREDGLAHLVSAGGYVKSAAAGIFNDKGEIAAAIGISFSILHCPVEEENKYLKRVRDAAALAEKIWKV